jgi:plasmid maintenance system antidote protein VapI
MKPTSIHIGKQILSVMGEKRVTKANLARLLGVKPQSVDYLLKRKSIDTDTMYNISLVLDFDFSGLYRINLPEKKQINFDIKESRTKVLVEVLLNKEDIAKLNLKNRVLQLFDNQ